MERTIPENSTTRLTRSAFTICAAGGAALFALAVSVASLTRFDASFVIGVFAFYVPGAALIVLRIRAYHPHDRVGSANIITLGRLMITSLIAGLAYELLVSQVRMTPMMEWSFLVIAVIGLILDGFDGPVARREGLASRFGSRFDMEVDAVMILVLSIAVYCLDKAGWWVMASGALRYLFVAASYIWPALGGALPPAWRRKIISGIQGGVLAALLAPIIVPPLSTTAAAIALLLLVYSFAVDIIWLMRPIRSRP